jgi:hypothetical protein
MLSPRVSTGELRGAFGIEGQKVARRTGRSPLLNGKLDAGLGFWGPLLPRPSAPSWFGRLSK